MKQLLFVALVFILGAWTCEEEEIPLAEYCTCTETFLDTSVVNETETEGACEEEYDQTIVTFDFGEIRYICETVEK